MFFAAKEMKLCPKNGKKYDWDNFRGFGSNIVWEVGKRGQQQAKVKEEVCCRQGASPFHSRPPPKSSKLRHPFHLAPCKQLLCLFQIPELSCCLEKGPQFQHRSSAGWTGRDGSTRMWAGAVKSEWGAKLKPLTPQNPSPGLEQVEGAKMGRKGNLSHYLHSVTSKRGEAAAQCCPDPAAIVL